MANKWYLSAKFVTILDHFYNYDDTFIIDTFIIFAVF